ncbi:MAG: site-specific DNA-methyltransferase [Deltaproteobacteria bacterium]|nr:site-specific DNA-methyltransferase [Deltaproteobacteria bacterium]
MVTSKKTGNYKKSQVGRKGGTAEKGLTEPYRHPTAESLMRPEVGTQAQFRKKKPPVSYRYDSSLSPALEWDGQNPAREQGEVLIAKLYDVSASLAELQAKIKVAESEKERAKIRAEIDKAQGTVVSIADGLKALGKPFLNWAGKAERLSFDVPTLPLFVHERLSTKAIIETLASHKKDRQLDLFSLFGDPQHSITDQILKAYEYKDKWVNRLVLGDSLVVMNSLVHYEGLGGQVQMIYMDPPYGVKFGSNFQPFVRKRDVKHNEDDDMTREPEMVKAYRDTWELGLHSYLTYMRDRLLIARELLTPSGSIFVQISDENLHHVREVMDEVFGAENFASLITFQKTTGSTTKTIPATSDYLLWYAKEMDHVKFRKLFERQSPGLSGALEYKRLELADGSHVPISHFNNEGVLSLPPGAKIFATDSIVSKGGDDLDIDLEWEGKRFRLSCKPNRHWKPGVEGIKRLWDVGRLLRQEGLRIYKRYFEDFPFRELVHVWADTRGEDDPDYVVQTHTKVLERCINMTTDPGDLVLDPTCGSGTTAYVAEQWGRRWITIDTSRVPLALARQRLLTATFPYYELREPDHGPAGGFIYKRKQNNKGEEVGGIVPHVTLKSIANNEPPAEEVLVDRPETVNSITRVSGPFCLEATIPTPVDWEGDGVEDWGAPEAGEYGSFIDRMLEVLRRSPVLHLDGGKTVEFKVIRKPAKTLSLSAEALVTNGSDKPVAILFGPENGAISEKLVYEAAREAHAKNYSHLFVIGFAIQPGARNFVDNCEAAVGVPATYVQATPDLLMGDLLKNMRSSQIFSVCGLPEVVLRKLSKGASKPSHTKGEGNAKYQVELLGLDVFDPVTMMVDHRKGNDVPAWFLDTDYNGLCFHVSQAFFPRTSAWDNLKRALKSTHEDSVWDHLAGTISASFEAGEHGQIAVKVIDDRGNELLVLKNLAEAKE